MTPITSIEQLIECFDEAEPSEQAHVLKRTDISIAEFEKHATWKKEAYSRNCLVSTEAFEIILICWDTKAKTPIHGHDGQDCYVLQVSGTLTEKRFKENENGFTLINEANFTKGTLSYMNDRMGYHTLENLSNSRAMTIHVYANPISSCKVYNEEKSKFEIKTLKYDSISTMELNNSLKKI